MVQALAIEFPKQEAQAVAVRDALSRVIRYQIHDQLARGAVQFNIFSDASVLGHIEYVNGRVQYRGAFYPSLYRSLGELEFKVVRSERNVD